MWQKRSTGLVYFPYTEKVAAYIQRSAKFWTWQAENFPYIQFKHYFPEKEGFRACRRMILYIRAEKNCICPKGGTAARIESDSAAAPFGCVTGKIPSIGKTLPLLPSAGDCPGGAGLFAESAADAFWVVGIFHRIAVHLAGPGAGPAAYAFVRVCPVSEDRDGVKH